VLTHNACVTSGQRWARTHIDEMVFKLITNVDRATFGGHVYCISA
jgi:hypothetical protein